MKGRLGAELEQLRRGAPAAERRAARAAVSGAGPGPGDRQGTAPRPRSARPSRAARADVRRAARALARIAARRPLILVIDDYQWSDTDSHQLLQDLLRPPDAPALQLILTDRGPRDRDALQACVTELPLTPLAPDDARALASQLLGADADASAEKIATEAGGHPFYIGELARFAGTMPRTGGGGYLDGRARSARHTVEVNTRSLVPPLAVAALAAGACGDPASSAYDGTVVVGRDYVQALVTAPGDTACPPRVQRAGSCVRTPTAPGTCADEPACVTGLEVRDAQGNELGAAAAAFADVPALLDPALVRVAVEVRGCGGTLVMDLDLGDPVAAFAGATATVESDAIEVAWSPSGEADLVCALWTEPGFREVCCAEDTGAMTLALTPGAQVDAVYLSRGRLLDRVTSGGTVEVYRTAETSSLAP